MMEAMTAEDVADAMMELLEHGIDEDAHLWGRHWRDIDPDEFDVFMKDPTKQVELMSALKGRLVARMEDVSDLIRQENAKHGV